jgi:hypothetical protein
VPSEPFTRCVCGVLEVDAVAEPAAAVVVADVPFSRPWAKLRGSNEGDRKRPQSEYMR